jgi:hypothetical protein
MSWYRVSFPRSEASTKIAELAVDFHDTVVAGPSADVNGSSTGMWREVTFSDGNTGWTMAKNLVAQ